MTKVRVYEVARELGLENRTLVQKVASLGIQVRNHMSALDPAEVDRIKRSLEKEKQENLVEERIRPTVVRRRTVGRDPKAASGDAPAPAARPAGSSATLGSPATLAAAGLTSVGTPQRRTPTPPQAAPSPAPEPPTAAEPISTQRVAPSPVQPRNGMSAHEAQPQPQPKEAPPPPAVREPEPERTRDAYSARDAYPTSNRDPFPPSGEVYRDPNPPSDLPPAGEGDDSRGRSSPPPASVRFAHANLPPGVVARGNAVAPGAAPLSDGARARILTEHAQRRVEPPRRRELGRAALGPTGRQPAVRPGRRKLQPGKKGNKTEITLPSAQKRVIRIEDQIQLQTLAQRMSLKATDVLMKLMQLGMANVHINSTLDADTAKILANEFNYEVENVARTDDEIVKEARGIFEDTEGHREARPPIVTVMGHVDHGKTSLLDRIRRADVAGGEAGGITQHIGAYHVEIPSGTIVFLDTPGHEAFTAMRARGAQATDIVILVVAADDGVMPQTKEAVHHAKAAGVPIIVAVNKIDKPGAKPDIIKNELTGEGLQPEEWGGQTAYVEVSALTGQGVDKLLEAVLVQSEVLELKANAAAPAEGVVLESYVDRGRGPVANVLVRNGTLKPGDYMVAGGAWGRVRALTNDRGKQVRTAAPATPVEVLGLSELPDAGDKFYVVTDPKKAQEVAEALKQQPTRAANPMAARGLDQIYQMMQSGETAELKLVVKADMNGSVEALVKALTDLSTPKVKVNVIHTGVGGITENDVMLASASNAIITGFNVRPAGQAGATAKKEGVDIRQYNIIYEAVDEVKKAMAGLLAPKLVAKELGKAEVRQTFNIPKIGTIAGCYVLDGQIKRAGKIRLVRDSVLVWEGAVSALKRFKDDAREVGAGFECGISLAGYNDIKEKDILECYELEEVAATL